MNIKENIIGKKVINYKHQHNGCDNKHIFTLDDNTLMIFGHEDSEGYIDVTNSQTESKERNKR